MSEVYDDENFDDGFDEERLAARINLGLWQKLFLYARAYPKELKWLAACAVVTALMEVAYPLLTKGVVDEVTLRVLLRDFDTEKLANYAELLRGYAQSTVQAVPGCQVDVEITPQYRNLADGLKRDPRVADYAELAHQRLGRMATREIIRGGTDGSRLTELGLPTPNLSTGQHNLHSHLEWACLDEMVQAVELLIELVQVWASER